ncbi:uncharacterized protein LOC131233362 [Magnolia sinica]|uniref:uncharacterized protein LOC131233362 n=1 Tax=Magnolia sinica TaxID=86752 RepID=UPI00265A1B82|nr:uncharacterized protein LOC131233362 [Magnolia sinica]
MKGNPKDVEKQLLWDQMTSHPRSPKVGPTVVAQGRGLPKLMIWLIPVVSFTYIFYTLKLAFFSNPCDPQNALADLRPIPNASVSTSAVQLTIPKIIPTPATPPPRSSATDIHHIVFGIAASAKLWAQRKNYIKLWWKPKVMRGVVWLDKTVPAERDERLPTIKISSDTSTFRYTHRHGHRSAIRISRIVSETLRLGLKDVRWFVMGDDDTVFVAENLVRVLSKFDHTQFYYIGSSSESHLQNIYFSYGMAYGGGGFAISYPLAKALDKIQDSCIQRYPGLYGSDDRIQACMAELGVPLTKHAGFHQYDVYGNLFGLLAAHPVAPLVTLHHLDVVEPIFPKANRVDALRRLFMPIEIDSAGILQQSICYYTSKKWTISVSWGYAVQIFRGGFSPREMEMPSRTFLNWYRKADYTAYAFNTRPVSRNPCQKPFVYHISTARYDRGTKRTVTEYLRHRERMPSCKWKMADPTSIQRVEVYKRPDPALWDKSPRRNCCRVLPSKKKGSMLIDVGVCREGEIVQV